MNFNHPVYFSTNGFLSEVVILEVTNERHYVYKDGELLDLSTTESACNMELDVYGDIIHRRKILIRYYDPKFRIVETLKFQPFSDVYYIIVTKKEFTEDCSCINTGLYCSTHLKKFKERMKRKRRPKFFCYLCNQLSNSCSCVYKQTMPRLSNSGLRPNKEWSDYRCEDDLVLSQQQKYSVVCYKKEYESDLLVDQKSEYVSSYKVESRMQMVRTRKPLEVQEKEPTELTLPRDGDHLKELHQSSDVKMVAFDNLQCQSSTANLVKTPEWPMQQQMGHTICTNCLRQLQSTTFNGSRQHDSRTFDTQYDNTGYLWDYEEEIPRRSTLNNNSVLKPYRLFDTPKESPIEKLGKDRTELKEIISGDSLEVNCDTPKESISEELLEDCTTPKRYPIDKRRDLDREKITKSSKADCATLKESSTVVSDTQRKLGEVDFGISNESSDVIFDIREELPKLARETQRKLREVDCATQKEFCKADCDGMKEVGDIYDVKPKGPGKDFVTFKKEQMEKKMEDFSDKEELSDDTYVFKFSANPEPNPIEKMNPYKITFDQSSNLESPVRHNNVSTQTSFQHEGATDNIRVVDVQILTLPDNYIDETKFLKVEDREESNAMFEKFGEYYQYSNTMLMGIRDH